MSRNADRIKKGSIVRISLGQDHVAYGEILLVEKVKLVRGTATTQLTTKLIRKSQTLTVTIAEVTLMAHLTATQMKEMDEAVAKRVTKERADRDAYIAKRNAERKAAQKEEQRRLAAWDKAVPTVTWEPRPKTVETEFNSRRGRIELLGAEYTVTTRRGEVKSQDRMQVDLKIERPTFGDKVGTIVKEIRCSGISAAHPLEVMAQIKLLEQAVIEIEKYDPKWLGNAADVDTLFA